MHYQHTRLLLLLVKTENQKRHLDSYFLQYVIYLSIDVFYPKGKLASVQATSWGLLLFDYHLSFGFFFFTGTECVILVVFFSKCSAKPDQQHEEVSGCKKISFTIQWSTKLITEVRKVKYLQIINRRESRNGATHGLWNCREHFK